MAHENFDLSRPADLMRGRRTAHSQPAGFDPRSDGLLGQGARFIFNFLGIDSSYAPSDASVDKSPMSRWMGWRLRLLVACALLGCLAIAGLIGALAASPHFDARWRANAEGRIELIASEDPLLQAHLGKTLTAAIGSDGTRAMPDALALQRSPRWVISDADRARQKQMHLSFMKLQRAATVELFFSDGSHATVMPRPRGLANLPLAFWLLALLGLGLYLMAVVVLLAHPSARNLIYAVMALCQSGNLLLIATEASFIFGLAPPFELISMPLHMAFDLFTAAAMINAACLHPRRLPHAAWIALLGWVVAAAIVAGALSGVLAQLWWWTQLSVLAMGAAAIGLLSWSYRIRPHPFAILLRRFGVFTAATWLLLTLTLAVADQLRDMPHNIADVGSMVWYFFLGSLLILVPFMARSQQVTREFSLLAAVTTIATSLDLVFVAVFSLGQFASLTLSLFLSFAVYSAVRQWILGRLLGSRMLTAERMFEQLYRIAREVETQPARAPTLLAQLLGDLFEPMENNVIDATPWQSHAAADGSGLLVPIPSAIDDARSVGAVMLRFAQRGRRLFTHEDARLTDRIVEQLRRAVRFNKAVEQGRAEERLRLAQDLHDDIGARLLTLMYKAQSPEMEEYLRHTLQDLKTLTRGLAAADHRLSHAAAEWKSDLTHRLDAAQIQLKWTCEFDEDILLSVVHWSALTRILRELVSNVIAHARARWLDIDFRLQADRVDLVITDDGSGRNPQAWSHGLGLGGVRKRVKQLGGEVEWCEAAPRGISCLVVIENLSAHA